MLTSEARGGKEWIWLRRIIANAGIEGNGDGFLPEETETYPELMRKATGEYVKIERAQRVFCCERPAKFVEVFMDRISDAF
jgi:hypothetical protein